MCRFVDTQTVEILLCMNDDIDPNHNNKIILI